MSLITRCPACETLFRVVPDQLRISEGWVRCGQCDEIFDASYHQLHQGQVQPAEPDAGQAEPVDDAVAPAVPSAAPPLLDIDLNQDDPVTPLEASYSTPLAQPETPPRLAAGDSTADHRAKVAAEDFDFLRAQKSSASKQHPYWRASLFVLTFLLLMGLLLQMVVHERDRLAARSPSFRYALQTLCTPLGCTLSPLRRLDSIMVESASFTKQPDGFYRLNFLVKNTAAMALAVPAIELTLTNSFDQTVLRRVFEVKEFGAPLAELAAGAEWQAMLTLEVKANMGVDPVAGYRVLAFYP